MFVGLDLGTVMGWATKFPGCPVTATTRKLTGAVKNKPPGTRYLEFETLVLDILATARNKFPGRPVVVGYEDVAAHRGVRAAHVFGGFKAVLQKLAATEGFDLRPYGVTTVKKAVLRGGATKPQIATKLLTLPDYSHLVFETEDASDAAAVLFAVRADEHNQTKSD